MKSSQIMMICLLYSLVTHYQSAQWNKKISPEDDPYYLLIHVSMQKLISNENRIIFNNHNI